jgi:hypothetical protein
MNGARCNYFSLETEEIKAVEGGAAIKVPVRRCLLAEQMATLLSKTPEGRRVLEHMALPQGQGGSTRDVSLDIARLRVAFGPDLQAVMPQVCTVDRCMASCSPGFKELLVYYGSREQTEADRNDFRYPSNGMAVSTVQSDGSETGNG